MLYSCSLEWVDVFRPLGVHMGPILQEQQWIKCFGVPSGSQHNGGYKYISLPWWQFWGLGTPKWTQNLVSKHSKLSRMVRVVPRGLSGPEIGQMRRSTWMRRVRSDPPTDMNEGDRPVSVRRSPSRGVVNYIYLYGKTGMVRAARSPGECRIHLLRGTVCASPMSHTNTLPGLKLSQFAFQMRVFCHLSSNLISTIYSGRVNCSEPLTRAVIAVGAES